MTMRARLAALIAATALLTGATPATATDTTAPTGVTGCYQDTRGRALSSDPLFGTATVWLYGDSITHQNRLALYPTLTRGSIAADTWWGRTTAPTVQALGADVHATRHRPSVVVMATGTNDLADPAGMARQVQLARAVLPTTTRLLWVNAYTDTVDAGTLAAVNDAIASVAGVQVIDWAYYNEAWKGDGGTSPLLSDGIHLSCLGQTVWVNLVRRSIVNP